MQKLFTIIFIPIFSFYILTLCLLHILAFRFLPSLILFPFHLSPSLTSFPLCLCSYCCSMQFVFLYRIILTLKGEIALNSSTK